jgi:hypothetical protein
MPGVRNSTRAKRICNGAARGRKRCHNTCCSRFVLIVLATVWAYLGQAAPELDCRLTLGAGNTATSHLARASVVAANVADTTGASSTQSCRHFQQA